MNAKIKLIIRTAAILGFALALGTALPASATGSGNPGRFAALRLPPFGIKDVVTADQSGSTTTEAGGTVTFNVTLNADPLATVTVNLSSSKEGEGTVLPLQMTFDSTDWSTPKLATVTGQDDSIDDGDVPYTITLDADVGADATVDLTNTDDDDPPTVSFTTANQEEAESIGSMTVTAQLSGESGFDVTVPFSVGGTAADPADYTITPSPLTIDAGTLSEDITITITNDTLPEANETVIITMGTPTNADKGATDVHTATINDNDLPSVTFSLGSQSPVESAGTATITAQLSTASTLDVTVPYIVTGDALGGGVDYSIDPSPLVIDAGSESATITITINTDDLHENDETVIVTMGDPENATKGATTAHTATITDDDEPPTVTFLTPVPPNRAEGDSPNTMVITAQLSEVSGLPVTVNYILTGSSATQGSDYTIAPAQLSIPAGQQTDDIVITVSNDSMDEPDETVVVTMGTLTNATPGTDTEQTATINDNDDLPTVNFTADNQNKAEGPEPGNTMTVTAQLSDLSGQEVTVPYIISGTASQDVDYTILPASPLTIPAGNISAAITVDIINDSLYELNETVILTMGTPVNATKELTNVIHTATILDNDNEPTVKFVPGSQSANEGSGAMNVTVQLSAASGLDVEIPFTLTGSSAIQGTDYTITPSPVIIPAGDTEVLITITLLDDFSAEPNETVILTMQDPDNGDIGSPSIHTATILNDDFPGITLLDTNGDPLVDLLTSESGLAESFTVALDTLPSGNVVVDLTSSDLTEGTVSPASLTFTTANWSTPKIVTVTGVNDFTADLDMAYNVTLHVNDAQTLDPNYDALADIIIPALNSDDDTPGYTVSPTTGETTEAGITVTIDILLKSRPKQPVTLDFIVDDDNEGTLSTDQIVIQPEAWVVNTPYKLVVTGVDDPDPEPDQTYHVVITPDSTDLDYNEMEPGQKEKVITLVNKDAPSVIWVLPVGDEKIHAIDDLVPVLLRVANAGDEPIQRVVFYYWDPEDEIYVPIGEDFTAPYQAYLVNIHDLPLDAYTQVFARAYAPDPPGPQLPTFSAQKRILIFRRGEFYRNYMPFVR